jgi:hypothetical protein
MTKPLIWRISLLVVIACVLALAWLVWPTCYRYDRLPWGDSVYAVRTNRLTGTTEMLTGAGWVRFGHLEAQTNDLPKESLSALTGTGQWHGSKIEMDIYNGTEYVVTEITVQVETCSSVKIKTNKETPWWENSPIVQSPPVNPNQAPGWQQDRIEETSRAYLFKPVGQKACKPLETRRFTATVLLEATPTVADWHWTIKNAKGVLSQK